MQKQVRPNWIRSEVEGYRVNDFGSMLKLSTRHLVYNACRDQINDRKRSFPKTCKHMNLW